MRDRPGAHSARDKEVSQRENGIGPERDRREPIIVEALLYQIPGVEQPTIEKLFAVGLGRLEALINANAGDVAAVSGLRPELATAIVQQFKAYRASATATVAAYVSLGGFGRYLIDGLAQHNYAKMASGAILVAVLAVLADALLAIVQRYAVSRGLSGRYKGAAAGPVAAAARMGADTSVEEQPVAG